MGVHPRRVLRRLPHLDALHLLLLRRIPLKNCEPILRGHVRALWPLSKDREARPAISKSLHRQNDPRGHEDQGHGPGQVDRYNPGQCDYFDRCFGVIKDCQFEICDLQSPERGCGCAGADLIDPKELLWTVRAARPTGEEEGNCRWHRKADWELRRGMVGGEQFEEERYC